MNFINKQYILIAFVIIITVNFATNIYAKIYHKTAYIVVDYNTGAVIAQHNADNKIYPASLTKLMTLYITFSYLRKHKISLNDKIWVSKRAKDKPRVKVYISSKDGVTIEQAIKFMTTKSANDVAYSLAENISSNAYRFTNLMNLYALIIGLKHTHFSNPSGLYSKNNYSTARDLAYLSLRIMKDFPEYYHYFNIKSFKWHKHTYNNTNKLLGIKGIDGLKTGYISKAGFNLALSAYNGQKRIVIVGIGFPNSKIRNSFLLKLTKQYINKGTIIKNAKLANITKNKPNNQPNKSTGRYYNVNYSKSPKEEVAGSKITINDKLHILQLGSFSNKNNAKKYIKSFKSKYNQIIKYKLTIVHKDTYKVGFYLNSTINQKQLQNQLKQNKIQFIDRYL